MDNKHYTEETVSLFGLLSAMFVYIFGLAAGLASRNPTWKCNRIVRIQSMRLKSQQVEAEEEDEVLK
jgi:hypothetical protein